MKETEKWERARANRFVRAGGAASRHDDIILTAKKRGINGWMKEIKLIE